MHLSRLAEEIVIWCSAPFRFVRLSDAFTTGSSIMPQKRNPDAAELVRAKTGRITGGLVALLTVMKGLPLAYQKDMQEDKQGAMEAVGALSLAIRAMTGMVADIVPEKPSSYFKDHVWGCFFDDAHGLKSVDEIGEDNITYESDYPHSDSTWPRTREIAEEQMADLTDEQRRKIVRGNAIKLFGLDFPA